MNQVITDNLSKYGFQPVGSIELDPESGVPKFVLNPEHRGRGSEAKKHGWVYAWVRVSQEQIQDICYIGKAGQTLRKRFREHTGGFRGTSGSKKGLNNCSRLQQCIQSGSRIVVYARHSAMITVNDEQLSAFGIDEESFIIKFRHLGCDLWNS
jgi:hypothetical protein